MLAASVFVVLLVAGVAWIGARTELVNVSGDSHESAAKINEPGQKPAIAVLPLINQNNDPARDYFADG